ncbi:MAG TPA: DUF4252 domain-containing protein [Steroidobacteraceae bacterium]|nr:DUF4252 domain-containing protein [Steroidobacteraceae bacterium]
MQHSAIRRRLTLLSAAVLLARAVVAAPEAPLKLPSFDALAGKAVESVNVTLDSRLLGIAAGFLDPSKPEDADARALIEGLKGIYVRSYEFDRDFAYPSAEVDSLRKQLSAGGWQQIVSVHGRRAADSVDIYMSLDGGKANGLLIIASEPREFTVVNIVGSIDLQKLQRLQGRFGIPKLPHDPPPPASP